MNKYLFFLFFVTQLFYAQKARIKGVILDENNTPVENVNVDALDNGTVTDKNGFYSLEVNANQKILIIFSHVSFQTKKIEITLKPNENFEFNPVMNTDIGEFNTVTVIGKNRKDVQGMKSIDPVILRKIPSANAGVESILKSFPGVYSNNELSTSYAVRGGNYDDNLVYVNEIEVYRPFLIRSGQQEGLSFTNSDLVEKIEFSAGGFEAKYGDKMASVLDISYRTPTKFGATIDASLLGVNSSFDWVSKNQKWTAITGLRYRNNSLLVNSQDTETNFEPSFLDAQTQINFFASTKWQWTFLGNISQNNYNYKPTFRQVNFGTIDDPIGIIINYDGEEKDRYKTYFGAVKSVFQYSNTSKLKFISSIYHTQEQEYYDILAKYGLGEVDTNLNSDTFSEVQFVRGIGSQLNHARNNLDALIINSEIKGFHELKNNNQLEWGFKFTRDDIRDRLVEWEVIDSAGFSLPELDSVPANDQPYNPYFGPLVPYQSIRALNFSTINRFSGYFQWNYKKKMNSGHEYWISFGSRFHQWNVNTVTENGSSQITVSPRLQLAFKPLWNMDMVFRLSAGSYNQPPFYRELRNEDGVVIPNVKAQKSSHLVLGTDYSFALWKRPFKITAETFYKNFTDVNTYTIDNVRIRYEANNNATAYAYGFDMRFNGEFVPGTESWFSFGYLKTEENQNNRGYIARPTDQRLNFALLFQDYMPNIPNLKLYINMVYNTGLPGGSPAYADPYEYQFRLNSYKRADVGFSYVFKDSSIVSEKKWLNPFKEFSLGFEIFNIFNVQNAITNTWVRDVYSKNQYGIPNYMTTRVFNLKLSARL